ncbi:MAG: DUF4405 domain-containing protein [Bdellovibrionaceae bacterium]|mgnify:CR=1 FL=1|nr:DUF4405 domain-containing protein [Pseudobdellovibrionaceae bacterium]
MKKIKVYDLPTRLFHWLFVLLFLSSFFIAKYIDDDSWIYAYHMLSGLLMAFLIILRVVWGLVGSKYARFSSFRLAPRELVDYLSSIVNSKTRRYVGHNPASSYAAIAMFLLTIGLVITGLLMSFGIFEDFFEEIHELLSNSFVIIAILHVAGLVFHEIKHKDGLVFSIVTGKKDLVGQKEGIGNNHLFAGIIFVGLVLSFIFYLASNYKSSTQKLNLFGTQVRLGETEHGEHNKHGKRGGDHDDHDDDYDDDDDDDDDD